MKNAKKLLALGLATTMLFNLVACGNESGNESSGGASTPDSSSAADDSSKESSTEEESDESEGTEDGAEEATYDFGGTVVKCFQLGPDIDTTDPLQLQAKEYVEQKYNIVLQRVQLDGYDGGNETALFSAAESAGAPAAHIVSTNPGCFYSMVAAGLLHDFSDSYQDWGMNKYATEAGTWRDHVYGWANDAWGADGLVYNRDYLEEIGMEKTPTDLFLEGKWDYESCRAYLAELQSKLPDGKYAIGTYPYHYGRIAANANGVVLVDNEGNINMAHDAVVEAVEFYQSLLEGGMAYPMTRNEEGVADLAYASDDDRIVITYGSPESKDYSQGYCPFPWSSNYVTCEGDYTTISDNYCTGTTYWGIQCVAESAEKDTGIPAEILMQIIIDYYLEVAGGDPGNWSPMTTQDGGFYRNPSAGTTRNFVNEDDITAYDWATSRKRSDFSWFAADAGVNIWKSFGECLVDRHDARSTLESYQQEGEAAMIDAGLFD